MSDIMVYNALGEANRALRLAMGEPTSRQAVLSNPNCYTLWAAAIPTLGPETGSVCVYDQASALFRDGNCCLWTVPGGTTKVRFQLWGAGAGTGAGLCCGGSPFGASGAYASIIIDAVPGCQYTLCAGAANSTKLYCTQCQDVSGCMSYVTGYGLTNFCADGGCSSLARNMELLHGTVCCRYQAINNTQAGACICGGSFTVWYCFANSCATCGPVTYVSDTARCGRGTSPSGTLYYIPSNYSAMCFDTSHYGCACNSPTMLPTGGVLTPTTFGYTSNTCCGLPRSACCGCLCNPGQGGSYTHAMGGSTDLYGDWGRTGMVRVSWC
jgi:hypothetical protein